MEFNFTLFWTLHIAAFFNLLEESVANEGSLQPRWGNTREKRSIVNLYQMISCGTSCNPVSYKGYGCFCGFMGSGTPVDGIDSCCKQHDECYSRASCLPGEAYLAPYHFECNQGNPVCYSTNSIISDNNCGNFLCECDAAFVQCITHFGCPSSKALCSDSPWSFLLNFGAIGQKLAILLQILL